MRASNQKKRHKLDLKPCLLVLITLFAIPLGASEDVPQVDKDSTGKNITSAEEPIPPKKRIVFALAPRLNPERPRNPVLPAFTSLLLPGFDQWWEQQYDSALLYSGIGAAGLGVATEMEKRINTEEGVGPSDIEDANDFERNYFIGLQTYQMAGSMSAYHSFRTAVRTLQSRGKYTFLKHEESPQELFTAPFRLNYLKRPSTYIPLVLGAVLGLAYIDADETTRRSFRGKDFATMSAISYNAGVGEEALFRGWGLPVWHEILGKETWSNGATATLFAAAHISEENKIPWAQLLMGYYLGWVTQKNQWQISESIFIHTWWDVLIISAYMSAKEEARIPLITIPF